MSRQRAHIVRFTPVALVVFAAAAIPRTSLLVHTHRGGDRVHVHAEDTYASHQHSAHHGSRAASVAAAFDAYDSLPAAGNPTAAHRHVHHVDTRPVAEWFTESSSRERRPWYDEIVCESLRRHAAATGQECAAIAPHEAAGPAFVSASDDEIAHWHAQSPFTFAARVAAPTPTQIATIEVLADTPSLGVVSGVLLPTHARGPPRTAAV